VRPYREHDSERVYRLGVRAWECNDRLAWGACVEELRRRQSAKALELADRLVVISEGRLVHETATASANIDVIGRCMAGHGAVHEEIPA
jgi:hypothetical protein